ncbi:acyltransferase family protein, partial [Paenibacillus sp. TAF58]
MAKVVQSNNRFPELDFVRAIAVIAVIVIHVTSITLTKMSPDQFTYVASIIVNQLSRFCVPAFLFVSGVLAFHSYKRNSYTQLIKGKIKDLIVPYVVWTSLGLLLFLSFSSNYKGIIMIFLTGNGPFYQLYYIPLLFQMFVFLPLIIKLAGNKKVVISILLLNILMYVGYQALLVGEVFSKDLVGSASSILQSTFVIWMSYFCLGVFAAQYYSKLLEFIKSKSTAFFVAMYVMSAIALIADALLGFGLDKQMELMGYFRVTIMIYSLASLALLVKLGMRYKLKFVTNLYRNSFGIYLIHVAVIKVIFMLSSIFFSNLLFIMLSTLLTLIISYWCVELIKRTPVSSLLLGQKNKSERRPASVERLSMDKRLEELDSLRGLAAIFVLFLHMYLLVPGNKVSKIIFEYSPFRLLISGGESVVLFFVLSGFVLSMPYFNNKQSSYLSFVVKRICRIYLPYLFTVFVVIGCRELFYSGQIKGYSGWFNSYWVSPINMEILKDHVLLIGTFLSNLDPVIWSLLHEMRISIIFPFLMLVIVRLDWKKGLALSLLFSLIGVIVYQLFKPSNTGTELVATSNYTAMFIVGALLAKYRKTIANKFSLLTKKFKIIVFAIGLITYLFIHP